MKMKYTKLPRTTFIELAAALYTNGKDTYKLVRNPYTRAVSSFFH